MSSRNCDKHLRPLSLVSSQKLIRAGFLLERGVVGTRKVGALIEAIESARASQAGRHSLRNVLGSIPAVRELANSEELMGLVRPVLGPEAFPVRGIVFDKTPGANWKVVWHQDLTIAVKERRDAAGFGGWSVKEGVPHVQAPTAVLERMLTLRAHLDDCHAGNGPLRVLAGTHRHGVLDAAGEQAMRERAAETVCEALAGDVLLMRPLLLHASSPAEAPGHRRVVHLEYAAEALPGGLEWAWR